MSAAEAIRAGLDAAREVSGIPVVYRRGALQVSLVAIPGRRNFDVQTESGVLYIRSDDFLIARGDLILGGQETEPARGDFIDADISGSGKVATFEVMPEAALPAWEWRGPYQSEYRIHTKRTRDGS